QLSAISYQLSAEVMRQAFVGWALAHQFESPDRAMVGQSPPYIASSPRFPGRTVGAQVSVPAP
ncbi:MAG: hypothetical protein KAJ78_04495, partial [Acidobacteria bacterium]|nr:hypothetical protein [Acidobacteriota bacterium]